MLLFCLAFTATDRAELVRCITQENPPRPRRIDPNIPRDLETIVLKAMEKEPQSRYASATELVEDLRRFLADKPIVARRATVYDRFQLWCRRNPVVATLTSLVGSLLVVIAIGSLVAWAQLNKRHRAVIANLERATMAEDSERQAHQQSTRHLYDAYLARAQAGRWSGRAGRRFDSLQAIQKAAELIPSLNLGDKARLELRNEAIACMALVDLRTDKLWRDPGPYSSSLRRWAFDSAVERFAKLDARGELVVYRLSDNAEVLRLSGAWYSDTTFCPYLCFSPDDRFLAARGYDDEGSLRVRVWAFEDASVMIDTISAGSDYERGVAFNPNSDQLAYISGAEKLVLHDIATNRIVQSIELGHAVDFLQFSPDGERIAVSDVGGIQVIDISDPAEAKHLDLPALAARAAWSADGQFLAAACHDTNVYIWDATDLAKPPRVGSGHLSKVRHVAFSASNLLMSTAWDQTTRIWDPFCGNELVRADLRGSRFSADGRWLAFEQSGVRVGRCEVAAARQCRVLHSETANDSIVDLDFSQDGSKLAGSFDDGIVQVYSPDEPDDYVRMAGPTSIWFVTISPDAKWVAASGKQTREVLVWDARTGERAVTMTPGPTEGALVGFSPDSRWLVVSIASEFIFYEAGSWQELRRLPGEHSCTGRITFSSDMQFVAVSRQREVKLYETTTFEELATFAGPQQEQVTTTYPEGAGDICFSRDGNQLAIGTMQGAIQIWDLKLIRAQLSEMDLDWK